MLLSVTNFLNESQLFNGDFVDRGSFSVECIFTLFGFKLLYPEHFFMSRGKVLVIEPYFSWCTYMLVTLIYHRLWQFDNDM